MTQAELNFLERMPRLLQQVAEELKTLNTQIAEIKHEINELKK